MGKRYKKGNIYKKDYGRVLLTDTLPAETPIIFSNDGFYKNYNASLLNSNYLSGFFDKIILKQRPFTIPFNYRIRKSEVSFRTLSLLHPYSQVQIVSFYKKYEGLICHYGSGSPFSIRYPEKIGSTYFFKNSSDNINKYKTYTVDTLDKDKSVRNPSSYFAYGGFDKLYKFFDSNNFLRFEKRFPHMWMLDVSKCFDSIYTHSICWATKDKTFSKKHINAKTFGDDFDKLMQSSNYNETSGICIGPEVSRIFAEIIFQKIDSNIILELENKGKKLDYDYIIKRYVDDIFIFAKDEETTQTICDTIGIALSHYKLHINEGKVDKYSRPFLTKKSKIISDASVAFENFIASFIESVLSGRKIHFPKRIYRQRGLVNNFAQKIKSLCYDSGVKYDMVANYIISSLEKRIQTLIEDFEEAKSIEGFSDDFYRPAISVLMETIFFFYTIEPSVPSSYKIAKSIILCANFFNKEFPEQSNAIKQEIINHSILFLRSYKLLGSHSKRQTIPLEVINIFLAISDLGDDYLLSEDTILKEIFDPSRAGYLEIVSSIYYIKDHAGFTKLKKLISDRINELLKDKSVIEKSSELSHLFLDILCCPHLDITFRGKILDEYRSLNSMPSLTPTALSALVQEFEKEPWFVNWTGIDLLSALEKKELSTVY